MPPESCSTNNYAAQFEPVEAFGYRRFESAQDFPDPPPFNNCSSQPPYQSFEQNEGNNWIDGFLHSPREPDEHFEELPETFVGMSTTLSAQERNLMLGGLPGYTNGTHSPSQIAPAGIVAQIPRNTQYNTYGNTGVSNKMIDQHQSPFGYDNIDPVFGHSSNSFGQSYAMAHDNNHYFPTPPLSTYVPNFFDNASFSAQVANYRAVQTPRRLQFGSDARFEGQGFVAPPEQETPETLVKRKMNHLECLKPEPSPASTHPSSPVLQKKSRNSDHHIGPAPVTFKNEPDTSTPEAPEIKPRKRRKTDTESDPDFETPRKPTRQISKRSKTSSAKKAPVTPKKLSREDSTPKSRPSSAKPTRQHLTDEQKKTNHIISEQKRRDLIKQGYEGIREMVPALKDVKHSKGAMLEAAADWLEEIVKCNKDLKRQLASMKGEAM